MLGKCLAVLEGSAAPSHHALPKTQPLTLYCQLREPQAAALTGPALAQPRDYECQFAEPAFHQPLLPEQLGKGQPNHRRDQGQVRETARILQQVRPFGDLIVAPGEPQLEDTDLLNNTHTSSSTVFPSEQTAKQGSSIELRPAEGGTAQRRKENAVFQLLSKE